MTWARRWGRLGPGREHRAGSWRDVSPASSLLAACRTPCCCAPPAPIRMSLLTAYFRSIVLLQRHGTFVALEAMRAFRLPADPDPEEHADWLGLSAYIYALLRDFEVAEHCYAHAVERAPRRPFRWVERSMLYELEDRYAEALEAAEQALAADPASRRAVQQIGPAADAARAQPRSHRAAAREAAGTRQPAAGVPARAARARSGRL